MVENRSTDEELRPHSVAPLRCPNSISDDVFDFYKEFGDASEKIFDNFPALNPSFDKLGHRSRALLQFSCSQRYSSGEINALHQHEVKNKSQCDWSVKFGSQFPSSEKFARYVQNFRKHFVKSEG